MSQPVEQLESPPEEDAPRTELRWPLRPLAAIAGLALILAITALVRWQYLETPLERDEGEFAYGGQLLLAGELPYVAFYAMKLPGIYLVYALLELAWGETAWGIHFGLLLVNLANVCLVYLLGRQLFDRAIGLCAAAAFALLTLSPAVQGTQAQAEHFVLLPALAGGCLLWEAQRRRSLAMLFASGLAFGLALLIKQHGAVFALFALAYLTTSHPVRWRQDARRQIIELAALALGAALPLAITCLFFAAQGAWSPFVFWTFTYAAHYARGNTLSDAAKYLGDELIRQLAYQGVLWIAAAVGLGLIALRPGWRSSRWFVVLWLLAAGVGILPGLSFFGHYFLLLSPSFAWCAAVALVTAARWLARQSRGGAVAAIALLLVGLAWPAVELGRFYAAHSPRDLPTALYGKNGFAEIIDVARYVAERSDPQERVALLGSEPELFFYADRRSVSGHIYMYPLLEGQPFALDMQRQLIGDIEQAAPRWMVFSTNPYSWMRKTGSPELLFDWIEPYLAAHYHCVARVDIFADRPSEFVEDAERLRAGPQGVHALEIYRRNAGDR